MLAAAVVAEFAAAGAGSLGGQARVCAEAAYIQFLRNGFSDVSKSYLYTVYRLP